MPNAPLAYTIFHTLELCPYIDNNAELFPARQLSQPGPVITADREEEWLIDCILDGHKRGRGTQYLVHFSRYGLDHDRWIARSELLDNKARESCHS